MLRINKLTDYALLTLNCLAQMPKSGPMSAQALATQSRLEQPTVSKVLKLLANAGLVESTRGVNGGYRLALAVEAITVKQVIESIEGPIGMTECGSSPGSCSLENNCQLKSGWRIIDHKIHQLLDEITLADMLRPMPTSRQPAVLQQPIKHQAIS